MKRHPVAASIWAVSLLLLVAPVSLAQAPVSLMTPRDAWKFNNGTEFPGATGGLSVDSEVKRDGHDTMKLVGDFTKGGNYVQAGRDINDVDIQALTFWVRTPDRDRFTIRLNDASGQTHQINVKLETKPGWQQIVLPLADFFAKRGQADSVPSIAKYESWGGAKDGRWHGPAKAIYLLLAHPGDRQAHTLWLDDITILPRPVPVAGAEIKTVVPLGEIIEGEHEWGFTRGEEFPGAKGSLSVVADTPEKGQSSLKLAGDFTGGGAYVAMVRDVRALDAKDVPAYRLRYKTDNATAIGIQCVDASGQTHQRKDIPLDADGKWHDFVIEPGKIAGGEHWGGADDAKWHGPPTQLVISLPANSDAKKQPLLLLADIRADVLRPVFKQTAVANDFEGSDPLAGWKVQGDVAVDKAAAQGSNSLLLARTLANVEKPCVATGPTFDAKPGRWDLSATAKAELNSPDDSYRATVSLECLDGRGGVIERLPLTEIFGKRAWKTANKQVDLPKGTAAARFRIELDKTYGKLWLDDLSASRLAPAAAADDRVTRFLFSTAQLGNLLLPDDPRHINVVVDATKPLRESEQTLTYVVRDYWGAEHTQPVTVPLKRVVRASKQIQYAAKLDLAKAPLEIGRYYEVHAAVPKAEGEPFRQSTSLAILPEAPTKRHRPEDVPFTSRNWDNRLTEYIRLTDRLGVRTCGIWGGWSSKPPYNPEAPGIELCEKLDMNVLTNTPCATIELGKNEYSEEALRQGVRNFLKKYHKDRPIIVNLGNEPHGTGEKVRNNVAAYKAVYEEIKKVDPGIFVVATSVEPNEEYFKLGYGKYCDAYDFHIYEGYQDVRKAMEQYRELMKKYGPERPLWSTELGLNSQGLTRHVVAVELMKTFTTFFAAGGQNASWFGLLYPDGDGKSYGSSGDAHNVFDCRFNRYAPRLDAVAYYNAVNAIAVKKFVAEKKYDGGANAFLFRDRDGGTLQILWQDKGRQDVQIPLPGVKQMQVIRIDGRRSVLDAAGEGVTLTLTEDPLILLYQSGKELLPAALGPPAATLTNPPATISRRGPTTLNLTGTATSLVAPPFWTVDQKGTQFTLTPPERTAGREAEFVIPIAGGAGGTRGELYYRGRLAE